MAGRTDLSGEDIEVVASVDAAASDVAALDIAEPDLAVSRARFTRTGAEGLISRVDFRAPAFVSSLLVLLSTVFVIYRSNANIDTANESLYLLMVDDPTAAIRSASAYHVLLSPLFALVGESIVGWRMLRAALDIGVDVVLGISLVRYVRTMPVGRLLNSTAAGLTVVSTVTLGGFASWIFAANSFGYGQAGSILVTALLAVVLSITTPKNTASVDAFLAVLGGALFIMTALVRWTGALGIAVLVLWILIEHCGARKTRRLLGAGTVGMVGLLALVHVALIDVGVLLTGMANGTSDLAQESGSLGRILGSYVSSLRIGVTSGVGLVLGAILAVWAYRARERMAGGTFIALLGPGVLVFLVESGFGSAQFTKVNAMGTYLFLSGVVLIAAQVKQNRDERSAAPAASGLSIPATLLLAPIALAAGTSQPILVTALPLVPLWIAASWVLAPKLRSSPLRTFGIVIPCVVVSAMPWLLWQSPETQNRTDVAESSVVVERGRFEGIRVDETTHQFLEDLEDLRVQLNPNPTVVSLWTRPIVPLALDGSGLGFPWYDIWVAPDSAAASVSGDCLENGGTPTGDVVMVTEDRDPSDFGPMRQALLDCGIAFPDGFDLLTTMTAPGDVAVTVYLREAENS